jgi:hypothetical protein
LPAISNQQALSIATMVELTDKDFQPLQFIKLEFKNFTLKAYATDRYVLARAVYELDEPQVETTIYLDRRAIKFIKDNAKTTSQFHLTKELIQTDNNHTYVLISDGSTLPNHDYDSILDKALTPQPPSESLSMNLDLITKVNKLTPPSQTSLSPAKRRVEWTMRVGGKHNPIVFTDSTNTFTALAQPLRGAN